MYKFNLAISFAATALSGLVVLTACNQPQKQAAQPQQQKTDTAAKKDTTATAAMQPDTTQTGLTLPVLDALFYEADFAPSLKSQLGLTASQIDKLRATAHASLRELSEDGTVDTASVGLANRHYQAQISAIIGADKLQLLQQLVNQRYSKGVEGLAPTKANFVPTDTRIVVNAPAFRMDVFQSGKLLKSYRVGIGYPEFPLPTGMRRADTIIFNPAWTPPDEPWVKGKFRPGKKVAGGSEFNPLGTVKIPIGMPSLIHGGKPLEKIGNFASHGCVGLTNREVKDFAVVLAQLGGSTLPADGIRQLEKQKKTYSLKLPTRVPIDLRYETIVAENGSLHIYRDVYERGTNTLANAKKVLAVYGVNYNSLPDTEKTGLNNALDEMDRNARGNTIAADSIPTAKNGVPADKQARAKKGKVTRRIKGQTEIVVPVAALQGKGYPDPVDLDTGAPEKKKG
jgi:lipoprotein-anchoring transpeptidase ErfK/SrfK